MANVPIPRNEAERLAALRALQITDTPPEAEFDHIVRLAADLFHVPTALISFVDDDRQFFKARVGLDACETPRDVSFCAHAVLGDNVLVVPDARADERFRDNALVTGPPFIRFYAGAPLRTETGHSIGSLCVIDVEPRAPLTSRQEELLKSLAHLVMDHLERRRLDATKRAAMQMAAVTPDAIVCSGPDDRIIFWNAAAERMFGYSRTEAIGSPLEMLVAPGHRADHRAGMSCVLAGEARGPAGRPVGITALRKDGSEFPVELTLAAWSEAGRPNVGSIIRDLTERQQTLERVRVLTQFDRLTGLPNRVQFLERIDEALVLVGRFTVLKIGFDRFKTINGSLGMAAGDAILREAAARVSAVAGPNDLVARLGSDEFGLLRIGADDPGEAERIAAEILSSLMAPFSVHGSRCHLRASAGLVVCPRLGTFDDADAVLKAGLLALQQAKALGGHRSEVFRPQLGLLASERHRIEGELRDAYRLGQFELHYQPQARLRDGAIIGAEALLRWRHPERGLLSPAAFLPALEMSAIAVEVGGWITRTACRFALDMERAGHPIRIAVNLFAAQLIDAELYGKVVTILEETGLPPDRLELEITETTMLGLDDDIIGPLRRLRAYGVKIAFDDYGTGFASLSLLKRYPLTRLKIDRGFIRDIESDAGDAAIVRAVLALGQSLDLEVIAEGIETEQQRDLLASFGCTDAQGYHFGKPMPAGQFCALVAGAPAQPIAA